MIGIESAHVRSSRRELLKRSTHDLHLQLDARISELSLTEFVGYREFLLRTAQALVPLECLVVKSGIGSLLVDWDTRARSAALLSDLNHLHGGCLPMAFARGELSKSELLGALYVLEGSRLGGHVLLRRAQASDDERVRVNTRYLRANDTALWRSFLGKLESAVDVDPEGAVRGARFAFEAFARAFAIHPSDN